LPDTADIPKVAYYYEGDFETAMDGHPDLMDQIKEEVVRWQKRYFASPMPELRVQRLSADRFEIIDTRGLPGQPESHRIDAQQAETLLVSRPVRAVPRERYAFALQHHLVVERDNRFLPLAVAEPDLLQEFEDRHHEEIVEERKRFLRVLQSDAA
jgi:hypothetical protein